MTLTPTTDGSNPLFSLSMACRKPSSPRNSNATRRQAILAEVLNPKSAMFFLAGAVGKVLKRNPTVLRWQGKVVGAIYCGLGRRLALQER